MMNIFFFQMSEAVESVKKNNKVRSVIICSLVPGIFCAGKVATIFIYELGNNK